MTAINKMFIYILFWMPSFVLAQDLSSKVDRLRSAIMPLGFSLGALMAIITLVMALFSEKIGWGPFFRVLVGVGALCIANGVVLLIRNSMGGY